MSRTAYVNGRYVPHMDAYVHIEDRGYQFADGVYEVIAIAGGRLVDAGWHLDRLEYSLNELSIDPPVERRSLHFIIREVVRRNRLDFGLIYLQITRGVAARNHVFSDEMESSLLVTARNLPRPHVPSLAKGVSVISLPDIRWGRCDIKSVSLLPNVLGKQTAASAGAAEAWLIDDAGMVTEGTSSNAWIINEKGQIITRPTSAAILAGITRRAVIQLCEQEGLELVERAFDLAEARTAREAFLTSSSSFVKPVVRIDESIIADGQPGAQSLRLLDIYIAYMNDIAAGN